MDTFDWRHPWIIKGFVKTLFFMEVMYMAENENAQTAKPLTAKTRLLYGAGDWAFSTMSNVETFFFNYFLTNIANFAGPIAMTIATVTSTIDAVTSWIQGGITNAVKPGKFGRYRTWLVMVPWVVPFLYMFQFLKLGEGPAAYVIITLAFVISHFVWNIPWSANAALISVVGQTPDGRAIMSSSRATWNQLAGITFSYIGLPLASAVGIWFSKIGWGQIIIENTTGGKVYPLSTISFGAAAFILGWLMVLGYFVNFLATAGYEEIETGDDAAKKPSKTKASVGEMVKSVIQNPNLCVLIFGTIPGLGIRFIPPAVAAYYFQYVAGDMRIFPRYVLFTALGAFAGAFASQFIAKKFSSRNTMIYAYALAAAACFLIYLNYANVRLVIGLMILVQFCQGICYSVYPALFGDCAVYTKWKSNADARGFVMGLITVPLKVAIIGRSVIVNASLMAVGFSAVALRNNPELLNESLKKGITSAFALVPGIILLVGILLMVFGYRLTREKVVQYQKEIDARGN
jgi:GPH family glycoside/pentoside/hexuronide:cation symporter